MAGDPYAGLVNTGHDPEWEQLIEKAEFCLTTGVQPSEYDAMTDREREAFIHKANEIMRKRNPN